MEESRDIIKFIAQKRGISTKKLLSTIIPNLKRKNNTILTTKSPQKVGKPPQKDAKTLLKETKLKIIKNLTQKSLKLQKRKNTQNLSYEKPSKLAKRENLTSQKQQILSKTKIIREKLEELRHKLSKSELKEIRKHLYNIESKKELLELETTKEYLDELDKKILKLDEYCDDDFEFKGIENVQDLFKILIYKPTSVKSGYDNNYIQYGSEGDKIITLEKCLALIEPYLTELINDYKSKVNGKFS